ncbi:MAG TPA: Coq4 family protein [Polyangiaceae bacterium]|jgi:ubiquinone biosynthesis protein COQ4|nr:Coq4 family protein [Polyangiaceae bacterium]
MVVSLIPKVRFRDALKALNALFANPEDTAQVFRVVEALSGGHSERMLARFRNAPAGRDLLRERPELIERLVDRTSLAKLPEGSLGRKYLEFLDSEGITAEGLKQASIAGRNAERHSSADEAFLKDRMRDTHDLWHVVTGYKGDLIGEASLLAFIFAQTRNPGIGFIVGAALVRGNEPRVRGLIVRGFLRGARAAWLPPVKWESLLALPVAEVRRQLRVGSPPEYVPFRAPAYLRTMAAA